jgi:hypothetical protein
MNLFIYFIRLLSKSNAFLFISIMIAIFNSKNCSFHQHKYLNPHQLPVFNVNDINY